MARSKRPRARKAQAGIIGKADSDSYGRLRQALDAVRDASLAHYGLCETVEPPMLLEGLLVHPISLVEYRTGGFDCAIDCSIVLQHPR